MAKQKAEELAEELSTVCSSLRHKALAFVMQQAKEARLKREAQAKSDQLAAELT